MTPEPQHSVSRRHPGVDLRRIELLPSVKIEIEGPAPRVIHDRFASGLSRRPYNRLEAVLEPVEAILVEDAMVSGCFVVHDDRHLYLDTSIHSDAGIGDWRNGVEADFRTVTAQTHGRGDDRYAGETALIVHNEGGGTWGHFLIQNLPKAALFKEAFPEGKVAAPPGVLQPGSPFLDAFMRLGFRQSQLLPIEADVSYRFKEAVIVSTMYNFAAAAPHPWAIQALKGLAVSVQAAEAHRRIFVERVGNPVDRKIVNQDEVGDVLSRHGISPVSLGRASLSEQMGTWAGAEMIVCTLGSDLTNMVFAPPGAVLVVISPDWFSDAFFFHLSIMLGHRWVELRCGRLIEPAEIQHRSSFGVDASLLDHTLRGLLP